MQISLVRVCAEIIRACLATVNELDEHFDKNSTLATEIPEIVRFVGLDGQTEDWVGEDFEMRSISERSFSICSSVRSTNRRPKPSGGL